MVTTTMKPKVNRKGDEKTASKFDSCQTPGYAVTPLLPFLPKDAVIWEPAAGYGYMVEALRNWQWANKIVYTDILYGKNFFDDASVPEKWDMLVTNPPYSIKFQWLERCYELGKPFALLVPVETIGAAKAQKLMKKYGFEMMLLDQRVDFKMPDAGWKGSGAQFPTLWLTWNILPEKVMFGSFADEKKLFKQSLKLENS